MTVARENDRYGERSMYMYRSSVRGGGRANGGSIVTRPGSCTTPLLELGLGSSNMYDSLVPRLRAATGRGVVGIVRLRTRAQGYRVSKQCDFL